MSIHPKNITSVWFFDTRCKIDEGLKSHSYRWFYNMTINHMSMMFQIFILLTVLFYSDANTSQFHDFCYKCWFICYIYTSDLFTSGLNNINFSDHDISTINNIALAHEFHLSVFILSFLPYFPLLVLIPLSLELLFSPSWDHPLPSFLPPPFSLPLFSLLPSFPLLFLPLPF